VGFIWELCSIQSGLCPICSCCQWKRETFKIFNFLFHSVYIFIVIVGYVIIGHRWSFIHDESVNQWNFIKKAGLQTYMVRLLGLPRFSRGTRRAFWTRWACRSSISFRSFGSSTSFTTTATFRSLWSSWSCWTLWSSWSFRPWWPFWTLRTRWALCGINKKYY